jgi:hypothetical protein
VPSSGLRWETLTIAGPLPGTRISIVHHYRVLPETSMKTPLRLLGGGCVGVIRLSLRCPYGEVAHGCQQGILGQSGIKQQLRTREPPSARGLTTAPSPQAHNGYLETSCQAATQRRLGGNSDNHWSFTPRHDKTAVPPSVDWLWQSGSQRTQEDDGLFNKPVAPPTHS